MNLFTFNSKSRNLKIFRSLIATFSFLTVYNGLIITKIVKPSDGINLWQNNLVRLQRYVYQNYSSINIVVAGSSMTSNLPTSDIGSSTINLGMIGGCVQTAVEAVRRKSPKPAILLVEVNETIYRKMDNKMIGSIYNPFLYTLRLYIPMFRAEYQPASTFSPTLVFLGDKLKRSIGWKNEQPSPSNTVKQEVNNPLTEKLILQAVDKYKTPLTEDEKKLLRQEGEFLKVQLSQIRKGGVRVILFDVPRDPRLQATVKEKQLEVLMKELFPANDFEWLPKPPPRYWKTIDGVHLVSSEAKDYVAFLKNQLLTNKATLSNSRR